MLSSFWFWYWVTDGGSSGGRRAGDGYTDSGMNPWCAVIIYCLTAYAFMTLGMTGALDGESYMSPRCARILIFFAPIVFPFYLVVGAISIICKVFAK